MTLQELTAEFRQRADDLRTPYLWDDTFIARSLNTADNEAAERSEMLLDTSTASVCQIAMTDSSTLLSVSPLVVRIKRAKLSGETLPLILITVDEMDRLYPGWEGISRSVPTHLITDIETDKVQPYPLPNASFTMNMHVYRLPLTPMSASSDEPEIPDRGRNHLRLVNWALYEAFDWKDFDTYDPARAAQYLAMFTKDFGESNPRGAEWRRKHMGRSMLSGSFA